MFGRRSPPFRFAFDTALPCFDGPGFGFVVDLERLAELRSPLLVVVSPVFVVSMRSRSRQISTTSAAGSIALSVMVSMSIRSLSIRSLRRQAR